MSTKRAPRGDAGAAILRQARKADSALGGADRVRRAQRVEGGHRASAASARASAGALRAHREMLVDASEPRVGLVLAQPGTPISV
jgi:hypothetical protein